MNESERAALERLIAIALHDSGQSRKVASFLLAWWNARRCGGFDLTDAWNLDEGLHQDMIVVLRMTIRLNAYPDRLGYGEQLRQIEALWHAEQLAMNRTYFFAVLTDAETFCEVSEDKRARVHTLTHEAFGAMAFMNRRYVLELIEEATVVGAPGHEDLELEGNAVESTSELSAASERQPPQRDWDTHPDHTRRIVVLPDKASWEYFNEGACLRVLEISQKGRDILAKGEISDLFEDTKEEFEQWFKFLHTGEVPGGNPYIVSAHWWGLE
jgi:hypothetical protein